MKMMGRTILVLLFFFTWLMNSTTHMPNIQLNADEHKVHQSVDAIANSVVVLETVRSAIKVPITERSLFPTNILSIFKVQFMPLEFFSQFTISNQFIGFFSAVHYQSNYLP